MWPKQQKKEMPLQTKASSVESLEGKRTPKSLTEQTEAMDERDAKSKQSSASDASVEPPRGRKVQAEAEELRNNSWTRDNSWNWSNSRRNNSWHWDSSEPPRRKKRFKHGKHIPEKVASLAERTVAVSHTDERDVKLAQEYSRGAGLSHRAGKRLPEGTAQKVLREVSKRRREEASSTAGSDRSRKKGTRAADGQ